MLSVCKEYIHFQNIIYYRQCLILSHLHCQSSLSINSSPQNMRLCRFDKISYSSAIKPDSTAISQVLLQKISERRKANQKILGDIFRLSIILFTISIAVLLIIQFWSANLFQLVFGEKWALSGQIAKILVLVILLDL